MTFTKCGDRQPFCAASSDAGQLPAHLLAMPATVAGVLTVTSLVRTFYREHLRHPICQNVHQCIKFLSERRPSDQESISLLSLSLTNLGLDNCLSSAVYLFCESIIPKVNAPLSCLPHQLFLSVLSLFLFMLDSNFFAPIPAPGSFLMYCISYVQHGHCTIYPMYCISTGHGHLLRVSVPVSAST